MYSVSISCAYLIARHYPWPFHFLLRAEASVSQMLQIGNLGQSQCLTLHTLLPFKSRQRPSVVRCFFCLPYMLLPFCCHWHLASALSCLSLVPYSQEPLPPALPILYNHLICLKAPFITSSPPTASNLSMVSPHISFKVLHSPALTLWRRTYS